MDTNVQIPFTNFFYKQSQAFEARLISNDQGENSAQCVLSRLIDCCVNDIMMEQTPTFSKRDHDQGSVHEDGICQVLRNPHRLRLKELYKTDTWSHRQGRVTGRKHGHVVQGIQTIDSTCDFKSMEKRIYNIIHYINNCIALSNIPSLLTTYNCCLYDLNQTLDRRCWSWFFNTYI